MKKGLCAVGLLVLALWLAFTPAGQSAVTWTFPLPTGLTIGDVFYAGTRDDMYRLAPGISGLYLQTQGSAVAPSWASGPGQTATTGEYVFMPAMEGCTSTDESYASTAMVASRAAVGNWFLVRQAPGAENLHLHCNLTSWLTRIGGSKGVKITAFDVMHQPVSGNLTSASFNRLATRTFADNTALSVGGTMATPASAFATVSGTPFTLSTPARSTPYVDAFDVQSGLQAYLPASAKQDVIADISVVVPAAGVYRFYGIGVTYTRLDH